MSTPVPPTAARLTSWEKGGLVALAVCTVLFGVLVEYRNALMTRRMTDLDVYLRAAWAVRTGADLYQIRDSNGWHYHYPPLLAILLTPLASPPADADPTGMPPFALSVALWYVLNVGCLVFAVHHLASALEQTSTDPAVRHQPRGCRRWWMLRVLPVLACLPPIGHTLMRGQLNLVLLLLFCGMMAALVRQRRGAAGLWLAGAICVKIIPAFLLLYPLWRRDRRVFVGCAAGLVIGLLLIPTAVFGLERTVGCYRTVVEVVLLPGLTNDGDQSRAEELTDMTATNSQSLNAVLHNLAFPDRATRPDHALFALRCVALALGGLLTLATLLAAGWSRSRGAVDGSGTVLFVGALLMNMLLLSPVAHLHYFALMVPLVMGLLAHLPAGQRVGSGWYALLLVNVVAGVVVHIPGWEVVREAGVVMYATLAFWVVAVRLLWRGTRRVETPALKQAKPVARAA